MANKPNEGALFANKEKERDEQPNAKGSAMIGGVEYWVSAWTNTAQSSGERYQKLKFTAKEQQAEKPKAAPIASEPEFDDQIPF